MAIECGLVRAAVNTSTGNQDFTDANMTETPNAARFIITRAITDGAAAAHNHFGIGAATAVGEQWAVACIDKDNVGTTSTNRYTLDTYCVLILDSAGGIDGRAIFVSFPSVGTVRINWTNAPSAAFLITVVLFKVDNAEAGVYATGASASDTTVINLGWAPNLILAAHAGLTIPNFGTQALPGFGAAANGSGQYAIGQLSRNGVPSSAISSQIRNDRLALQVAGAGTGAEAWGSEVTTWGATSFTVTQRTGGGGGDEVGYLALDTGNSSVWVGAVDGPNSSGNQSVTDPNFEPQIVEYGLTNAEAYNTAYTNNLAGDWGLGVFTANDEYSNVGSSEDNVSTTNTQSLSDDTAVNMPDDDGTVQNIAAFVSLDANGWTLNHTAVAANVKKWFAWAIEEDAVPPAIPGTIGFITAGIETFSKPTYELWLTDDFGQRIAQLTTFLTLEASKVVNQIGFFNTTMPLSFNPDLIQPDRMVQLWRAPRGGRLALWRIYFIRLWEFGIQGSDNIVSFGGPDTNDLLRRRIVAAFAGSSQASKTDFADDAMKEIVTESIADGVAPVPSEGTRVWADLSIASDLSLGPTITKSFPFDKLLTPSGQGVLPVWAKAAKEEGTEVFYDIVPNVITGSSASFQFQTFTGQPGQDHTSRVVFDALRNNMANPILQYDYTEEVNYVYAGGQGERADRNVQQVADSDRYSVSQWGRIEDFADARNQSTDNGVIAAGNDRLNAGRPKIRFSAIPLDVSGTRFGRDWNPGDKVKARFLNIEFDTIIRAVTISINENGEESIGARLDFES